MHQDVRQKSIECGSEAQLEAKEKKAEAGGSPAGRRRRRRRCSSSSTSDTSDSYSDSSTDSGTSSSGSSSSTSSSNGSRRSSHLPPAHNLPVSPPLAPVAASVSPSLQPVGAPPTRRDSVDSNRSITPVEVPVDPHAWTSEDISSWVKWTTRKFKLDPEPDIARFPKDGQELCELSRADFWVCAGSRRGGMLLSKHFALSLYHATGRETSPMLNDNEPSEYRLEIGFKISLTLWICYAERESSSFK